MRITKANAYLANYEDLKVSKSNAAKVEKAARDAFSTRLLRAQTGTLITIGGTK